MGQRSTPVIAQSAPEVAPMPSAVPASAVVPRTPRSVVAVQAVGMARYGARLIVPVCSNPRRGAGRMTRVRVADVPWLHRGAIYDIQFTGQRPHHAFSRSTRTGFWP